MCLGLVSLFADMTYEGARSEGYRRLTFMMLDADIVAVSPSSVWRLLNQAGLLSKWNGTPSKKGAGFEQPLSARTARLAPSRRRTRLRAFRMLAGRQQEIHAERDRKLEAARELRQDRRRRAA